MSEIESFTLWTHESVWKKKDKTKTLTANSFSWTLLFNTRSLNKTTSSGAACIYVSQKLNLPWNSDISRWDYNEYQGNNFESYTGLQALIINLLLPGVGGTTLRFLKPPNSTCQMVAVVTVGIVGECGQCPLLWTQRRVESTCSPQPSLFSLDGLNPSILLWWPVQSGAPGPSLGPRGRTIKGLVLPLR